MTTDDDWHTCHFCGANVNKKGYEHDGNRHFLSDCRPDLVEHEIGDTCTWAYRRVDIKSAKGEIIPALSVEKTCYAYQNDKLEWTKEHTHFYPDGPM